MIGIKLEGQDEYLETSPDTVISIRLENPILGNGDRLSPGSYSLPFNLPGGAVSPKNAARLKNPDVIENNEAFTIQNASLFVDGIPFKSGTLKSNSSEGNKIPSHFLFGMSQISPDFKNARLRNVLSENIVIDAANLTKKIYIKKTAVGDWNITVNGQNYTGSDPVNGINATILASLDSGQYLPFVEYVPTGTTPSGEIVDEYLMIWLRTYYTYYDEILEMNFYLYQDSVDPLAELHVTTDNPNDYLIESNIGDNYYDPFDTFLAGYLSGSPYPTDKFRFPVRFNADPYGEAGIKESEIINSVATGAVIRNDPNWGLMNSAPFQVKNYNSLHPFLRVKWILEKIGTEFGFTLEGDFYNHTDVGNMLLDNTASLDVAQNHIGAKKFVFWRRSFNINELVPDITVPEFFAALQSRYNLAVYYNEKTRQVRMQFREPLALATAYTDITRKCSPIQSISDDRVTGYTITVPKEDTDALSVAETITVGTPEETLELKAGSIRNIWGMLVDGVYVTGPRVSQKNGSKFSVRLFYYKGVVDDVPQAHTDGTIIYDSLYNFILNIGIYDTLWKYWLHYARNKRTVKLRVTFHLRELLQFDWEEKKRFDRMNYLVKSIEVKVNSTGVEVSSVELITMQ